MSELTSAILGAAASAVVVPIVSAIYRRFSGKDFVTKADCHRHHQMLKTEAETQQKETNSAMSAMQQSHEGAMAAMRQSHEGAMAAMRQSHDGAMSEMRILRKLLIVVALHTKVPTEKLEEFL